MSSTAIDAFLQQHLGSGWQLQPVPGGLVNRCWQVDHEGQRYFLKQQGAARHNGVDRVEEVRLQRALYQHHLTVDIVAWNASYELVLFAWVDAPTLTQSDSTTQLKVLADTLWRIHQQAPPLPHWSLSSRVDNYLQAIAQYEAKVANDLAAELAGFAPLLTAWDQHPKVLCHNDLAFAHILMSQPPRVVDWEYAGYGHPCFDLASSIAINELTEGEVAALCEHYSAHSLKHGGETITPADLSDWRQLIDLVNRLWFEAQRVQRTT
ncbi:hypothetical protein CWE12_10225 [Aliidiomarina sedimenti]|uniref:Aminoglycoside phosphotransferase domain-containing protein n=1 Tax=Aliidiomarina sedimenti TaxID=1933879 RepID=A0ABY0BYC7_9GAMM|nr:choline/ethanolamine kinase family protein [Aliidiomarina sedimenti]RUO29348.1 hypothetical protein CWE12_10225 [Aliidiomarina sedimenti]